MAPAPDGTPPHVQQASSHQQVPCAVSLYTIETFNIALTFTSDLYRIPL